MDECGEGQDRIIDTILLGTREATVLAVGEANVEDGVEEEAIQVEVILCPMLN